MNPKFILGYTDTETVKLDFDNTSIKQVRYWASRVMRKFGLKGYLILKSSKNNYHVVFDEKVSWKKNMSVVAWVSLYSQNHMLRNWLIMQCIKEESTLRISSKGNRTSPRIVFNYGDQDNQIREFMNSRNLVKRARAHPYRVLIAEIMLQRTKADQVEPVYLRFLEKFPNIWKLQEASENEIAEYIDKLGLFWRTKLIKRLAEQLVSEYRGEIPEKRDLLIKLPGIGDYIADAMLCFAFGEDVATIDVNICRVIERVFGIVAKGESRRNSRIRNLAQNIIPSGFAQEFNWAMIDLAALVCTSRNPKHSICPINILCSSVHSFQ